MSVLNRCRPFFALVLCFTLNAAHAEEKRKPSGPERQSGGKVEISSRREPEKYYIAIVGKPMKIERLDEKRFGNLEPWSIAEGYSFDKACMERCAPEGPACWNLCARDDPEAEVITVSNSCGYIRTTYNGVRLSLADGKRPKFTTFSNFVVYDRMGEWCRLRNLIHDEGEGLLLRKWGKSFYEITNFTVFEGTVDGYFLSTSDFSARALEKIKPMLAAIEEDNQVCYHLDDRRSDEATRITRPGLFRQRKNEYYDICETHGLPISKILSAYKLLGLL